MIRRPRSRNQGLYPGLSVLVILLLLMAGCGTLGSETQTKPSGSTATPAPPSPIKSVEATASLKKAQDLFNEAVKADQPTVNTSAAARGKYQQVATLVQDKVINQGGDSIKIGGYALLAFSQWRLGDFVSAMKTRDRGLGLYEKTKLGTNRRDYGMLLMTGGLSAASQTYKSYSGMPTSPTREQALKLTNELAQAMRSIDSANNYVGPQEPISIYGNLWQLALVDAALRIWTGLPKEVARPEICRWLDRADPVLTKIPAAGNPWQNLTLTYKDKFAKKKKAECQGR